MVKKSSSSENPLETITKIIKALKYPAISEGSNNDDDDDDSDFEKKPQKFHQLSKTILEKSIKESKIYKPLDVVGLIMNGPSQQNSNEKSICKITVDATDSLSAVVFLATNENFLNPAVLVFASDTNPGGSKTASNVGTQEEQIVRTSTLSAAQRLLPYPIPEMGVAYVPHVQTMLPKQGTFEFGAICCALRLCVSDVNSEKFANQKEKEFVENKIMSILVCALQHKHKSIVLGAIGSGAFSVPPAIVAQTFAVCLKKLFEEMMGGGGCFERIVFAIPTSANRKEYEKVFNSYK